MQSVEHQKERSAGETRKRPNETEGDVPKKVRKLAAEEGQAAECLEEEPQQGDGQAKQGDSQAKQGDGQAKQGDGQAKQGDGQAKQGDGQQGDGQAKQGDGQTKQGDGQAKQGDGQAKQGDGQAKQGDGQVKQGDGQAKQGDGQAKHGGGQAIQGDGQAKQGDGQAKQGDGQAKQGDGQQGDGQAKQGDGQAKQGDGQAKQVDGQAKQGDGQAKQGDVQAKQGDGQAKQGDGQAKQGDGQAVVKHQTERQKKMKKRLNDVRFRTRKLKKRVNGLITETEGLQEIKSRMDYAIRITSHYMEIIHQCLAKREVRYHQARDNVKKELLNEVEFMKNGQDLLQKTLNMTNEQLRKNYDLKYQLERDLRNLFQVSCMATDEYYANDYSGHNLLDQDTEIISNYESSEEWLTSERNIGIAKKEIQSTEALYFHMDNILWQISCTHSRQVNATNMAFNVSIAESKNGLQRLFLRIMRKLKAYNIHVKDPTMGHDLLDLGADISTQLKLLCTNEAEILAMHNMVVIQKF